MRVFVTGSAGQVGTEIVRDLAVRAEQIRHGKALDVIAVPHGDLDVADRDAVLTAIITTEPDVIIHAAAFTAVDRCESEIDRAFGVNAFGTRHVQEAARAVGAHVVYISTDYVFDGTSSRPYVEWDTPNPQSIYGKSKLGGERELDLNATIVRTSWVCGQEGANMVKTVLRLLTSTSDALQFVDDQHGCPTIAHDLAGKIVDFALARRPGVFHVSNQGATTWFEFAKEVVACAGGDTKRVEAISTADLDPPRPALRPANSVLDNAALRMAGIDLLPDWQQSLRGLVADLIS